MHGDLSEISAADACRELARRGATGALVIEGPEGHARIYLVEGRLVAAFSPTRRARLGDRLVGAGLLGRDELRAVLELQADDPGASRLGALLVSRGSVKRAAIRVFAHEQLLDALFELCGWRYGTFTFVPGDAPNTSQVPIDLAVAYALDEVARREREWAELSRLIPTLEAVPQLRVGDAPTTSSLEPDGFSVLASVDGERTIRDLATHLGYGEIETARIVHGLALLDLVEIRLPEDEVGAALDEAFALMTSPAGDVPDVAVDDPTSATGAATERADGAPAPSGADEPAAEIAEVAGRSAEPAAGEPVRTTGPDEPPVRPAAASTADVPVTSTEVSEFLRELSQLSLDPPAARPDPKSRSEGPAPARTPPSTDEAKRRKRGLFGWGG
jgi:hypothetical protein